MLRTHPLPQVVLTLPNSRWQGRMTTVLSSNCGKATKLSLVWTASNQGLLQIYAWQKIINYATVKKRGRLQKIKEQVSCNVVSSVRYEEFSNQRTVSKDPAESRPAGARAGRDYYFSNREEGQHLMACAETVM
jgi:hypothetical protein